MGRPGHSARVEAVSIQSEGEAGAGYAVLAAGAVILALLGGIGAFFLIGQPDQTPKPVNGSLTEIEPVHSAQSPSPLPINPPPVTPRRRPRPNPQRPCRRLQLRQVPSRPR